MNPHDRSNLKFLMALDRSTFRNWWLSVSEDDHQYALELLDQYGKELNDLESTDKEGSTIDLDVTDAKKVLDKIMTL